MYMYSVMWDPEMNRHGSLFPGNTQPSGVRALANIRHGRKQKVVS